jgi:L,D-transpeptidase YbiS
MIRIEVKIDKQSMQVFDGEVRLRTYLISTAKNGAGELKGSEKTPRGQHIVRAKIGQGCEPNTVFIGRRPTGEIYKPGMRALYPERDWILTRIFWLSGLEKGKNRLGEVDTMRRYIYIHGSPEEVEMGKPGSRGCIRMKNEELIDLYNLIPVGTPVFISE